MVRPGLLVATVTAILALPLSLLIVAGEPSNGAPTIPIPENGNPAATPPVPCTCSFYTLDRDHNGHVDGFTILFTEAVQMQGIVDAVHQQTLQVRTPERDRPYRLLGVEAIPGSASQVILRAAEMPFWDTGDRPVLRYSGTSIMDVAGIPLAPLVGDVHRAIDRSPPILVAAYGTVGGTELHLFWSEPVTGKGYAGSKQIVLQDLLCYEGTPSGSTLCKASAVYSSPKGLDMPYDTTSSMCQPAPKCRYFEQVYHEEWDASAVVTTMANPLDSGARMAFSEADVHWLQGDGIGVAKMPSRPCVASQAEQAPCDARIRDRADNGMWYSGESRTIVTYPRLKSAVADISGGSCPDVPTISGTSSQMPCAPTLILTFNGPVRGPPTAAGCQGSSNSPSPRAFAACNIVVLPANGPGQGAEGVLEPDPAAPEAFFLEADAPIAILRLDAPVRPVDVGTLGARIRLACNSIFGGRADDSAQGLTAVPCADPDGPYAGVPSPDAALRDSLAPRIVMARSMDIDEDGLLDGMFVGFSEPVDDSTFCQRAGGAPPTKCDPNCDTATSGRAGCSQDADGVLHFSEVEGPCLTTADLCTHYSFETDAVPTNTGIAVGQGKGESDDAYGFIRFHSARAVPTGVVPQVTTSATGLFSDLAGRGNGVSPAYRDANRVGVTCATTFVTTCANAVYEEDGASPVLELVTCQADSRNIGLRFSEPISRTATGKPQPSDFVLETTSNANRVQSILDWEGPSDRAFSLQLEASLGLTGSIAITPQSTLGDQPPFGRPNPVAVKTGECMWASQEENRPPIVIVTHSCVDLVCTFDAAGSHDPEGSGLTFDWTFSNGKATGAVLTREFQVAGSHEASLVVFDGTTSSTAKVAFILATDNPPADADEDGVPNHADNCPLAANAGQEDRDANGLGDICDASEARMTISKSCVHLSCTFTANVTIASPFTVEWHFGPGLNVSRSPTAAFEFPEAGEYSVELRVQDANGNSWVERQSVAVFTPDPDNDGSGNVLFSLPLLVGGTLAVILVAGLLLAVATQGVRLRRLRRTSQERPEFQGTMPDAEWKPVSPAGSDFLDDASGSVSTNMAPWPSEDSNGQEERRQ